MARSLTPTDAYALINLMVKEATGQYPLIQATDTSSFVSVGETLLASGTENTLNAISVVLGRTFAAVRPYKAKLMIINALNSGLFTSRVRKISYYSREAEASGAFNTDLYTNHAQGFDNGSNPTGTPPTPQSLPTMWEQNQPVPLELNFAGRSVWDDSTTVYEIQLQQAFRDEQSFIAFIEGIMVEKGNDIESQKEAFNRATLLNYMAGIYDMNAVAGGAFDLAAGFNAKFGTAYTRQDLLTTYFKEFLEYVVATIRLLSDTLENRSKKYHWSPSNGGYVLLRHTPKAKQRLILYKPFIYDAEARVLPEIFNDEYLKLENYEGVTFWQNELVPSSISVKPAIPDILAPTSQTVGAQVDLEYVVGVLYDEDAIMVDYQLEESYSTPVEARKRYRNIWWHFSRNSINDFTENGILLYIGDGGNAKTSKKKEA